jgi:hypothetical protein
LVGSAWASSKPAVRHFYGLAYYTGIFYNGDMSMATDTFPPASVQPLRRKLGLTQVELAGKLGVSQPLVAHL